MSKNQHEPNILGMQNVIRKKYATTWPNVILQLTNRVRGVNRIWSDVVSKLLRHNVSITIKRVDDDLRINVTDESTRECHQTSIPIEDAQKKMDHIEVAIMDAVANSLIMRSKQ